MATLTEQITKLTAKVEKCDADIARATEARTQAITQIQQLLGGGTTKAVAIKTKRQNTGKLGDRILTALGNADGQTREALAAKLRISATRAGLALYHLKNKGLVYEGQNDTFWKAVPMNTPATAFASTEPVVTAE